MLDLSALRLRVVGERKGSFGLNINICISRHLLFIYVGMLVGMLCIEGLLQGAQSMLSGTG